MALLKQVPLWLLAATTVCLPGCSRSIAQSPKSPANRSVELVVYSDDFALVQDTREVTVAKGTTRFGIEDVSNMLDQDSVVYSWPDTKDSKIRASTYELGTTDSAHLLKRFLGREVDLVYRADNGREGERQTGILQIADPGNVVVKVGDKLVVNPNATIEASAKAGVVAIPQLSAEVESTIDKQTRLAVSYLTRGLSWSADYAATLDAEVDTMSLECWGSVTNSTGTAFPDAKLTFVAGSPNRAVKDEGRYRDYDGYPASESQSLKVAKPQMQLNGRMETPQAVGELHAYPYKVSATIRPDQTNRVRMMGSDSVSIKRDYAIALSGFDSYNFYTKPQQRINATLSVKFKNAKEAGLGLPLPGGALRFYERSANGAANYIGASTLLNTPQDADVSATLTDVFDVYAQTRVVSTKKIDRRTVARQVEVIVHNEKNRDLDVRLVQDIWGTWKMATESSKSKKLNAGSVEWTVHVPKGGTTKLTYTVNLS